MRAFLRDIIDHVIKDSIGIGCAFSQLGKVTICAFDSILRPEYIQSVMVIIRAQMVDIKLVKMSIRLL